MNVFTNAKLEEAMTDKHLAFDLGATDEYIAAYVRQKEEDRERRRGMQNQPARDPRALAEDRRREEQAANHLRWEQEMRSMQNAFMGMFSGPAVMRATWGNSTATEAALLPTAASILAEEQAEVSRLLAGLAKPQAEPAAPEANVPSDYFALAKKLGLAADGLHRHLVLSTLQKEEIPVYNSDTVKAYLDSICKALTETIKKTGKTPSGWGHQGAVVWKWKSIACRYGTTKPEYKQTLPLEVLGMMDRVGTALEGAGLDPKTFHFSATEVSEYPDPFLSVTVADQRYVIMHWDEPGFSITK